MMEMFIPSEIMSICNWVEMDEQQHQVEFSQETNQNVISLLSLEKVSLPQNDEGVQVACGQHFSVCLTTNGKIVIWGSISGKITNDDGLFFKKPEYVCWLIVLKGLFIFQNRYLEGFNDRRMIQVAAGYTHCLGLTDVS